MKVGTEIKNWIMGAAMLSDRYKTAHDLIQRDPESISSLYERDAVKGLIAMCTKSGEKLVDKVNKYVNGGFVLTFKEEDIWTDDHAEYKGVIGIEDFPEQNMADVAHRFLVAACNNGYDKYHSTLYEMGEKSLSDHGGLIHDSCSTTPDAIKALSFVAASQAIFLVTGPKDKEYDKRDGHKMVFDFMKMNDAEGYQKIAYFQQLHLPTVPNGAAHILFLENILNDVADSYHRAD